MGISEQASNNTRCHHNNDGDGDGDDIDGDQIMLVLYEILDPILVFEIFHKTDFEDRVLQNIFLWDCENFLPREVIGHPHSVKERLQEKGETLT